MIREISNLLPNEEKEKLPKFYSDVLVAEENIENTREVIEEFAKAGLTFSKAKDLRTLTIEQKALIATIEKYREKNKFNIILNDVSLLRFKAEIVLSRIEDCEKVGKGYLNEDGSLQNFILNDDQWEEVAKNLKIDEVIENETPKYLTIDQAFDNKKAKLISEALSQEEVELDIEDFERYSMLARVHDNSFKAIDIILKDKDREFAEGIIMTLTAYKDPSGEILEDEDLVYAAVICLGNCTKEDAESIKPIIEALLNSEKMDLESSEKVL